VKLYKVRKRYLKEIENITGNQIEIRRKLFNCETKEDLDQCRNELLTVELEKLKIRFFGLIKEKGLKLEDYEKQIITAEDYYKLKKLFKRVYAQVHGLMKKEQKSLSQFDESMIRTTKSVKAIFTPTGGKS
jgi:hypothetical protein